MSNERNIHSASRPRRGMGPGRGMVPGEKAKDLKGALGKILRYMGKYKIAVVFVMIIAACSTVFSVLGPKVLGKATTVLRQFWKQVTAYISLHTPKNALQISVQQPLRC